MERILSDLISQLARVGFVVSRQPEKHRVRVEFRDTVTAKLVSGWLPVLVPRASADMAFDLPDVGDQVLCLFLGNGLEEGFVLGSMYGAQTPPVSSGDKFHRTFSDGTTLEYDRAAHKLRASVRGDVEMDAAKSISLHGKENIILQAPTLMLRGNLSQTGYDGAPGFTDIRGTVAVREGSVSVPNGDVVATAVSLVGHLHEGVQSGGGTSGTPVAEELPGNNPEALEEAFNETADSLKGLEGNDELLLCLPEIAEAEATRCPLSNDAEGWRYLKSMFHKWFSGPANEKPETNKEPFWVDWNWIMSYSEAKQKYATLKEKNYLFNEKAEKSLVDLLQEDQLLTDQAVPFDYISPEWNTWNHGYFQHIGVYPVKSFTVDGLVVAMGAFSLHALARGYVKPLPQGGHHIHVDDVAVHVWDSFSFSGSQLLGFWTCEGKAFALAPSGEVEYRVLGNDNFNLFRQRTGHGNDFLVLSQLHLVEDFKGKDYDTTQ
ncbi:phage baseplate assembly protein V [uncultured Bilophila sp.]|uniref:phage baseplate assembly protein V n=1 Tax=uncultured Bilophila sp. TaxID=529385 RepID=UPI0026DC0AF8|nr:phage baseplate assembly protein V [uncultured Bilophila sp.]